MEKDDDGDTHPRKLDARSIFAGSTESDGKQQYDFGFSLPSPQQPQPMDVDTSGGPIRLSTLIATPRPSEKKRKLNSGRGAKLKIRKLANYEEDFDADHPGQIGGVLRKVFGLRMLVLYSLVVVVAVSVAVISKEDLREEFFKRYMKQYNSLLYGVEDYCSQEFDFAAAAGALSVGMVGQQEAIEKAVEIVNRRQNERCISIALLGPTGVGKSLMTNIIATNFQWQSNVHHFFLDPLFTSEKRYERFQSFLYALRHGREVDLGCGRNLIIVDHLGSRDWEMVNKIDARLRFVADKDDVNLMILYAFQGALMVDDTEGIQHLSKHIEQVFLRSMNEYDLMRCIKLEAPEFEVNLDDKPELLEELIKSMDVKRYGCKAVRAKLALFSQISKK